MASRTRGWILALIAAMMLSAPAGGAGLLPVAYQVPLLLKLLTYEINLMNKAEPVIRLAVLIVPDSDRSRLCFEELQSQFEQFSGKTIRGRKVDLIPLSFQGTEALVLPPGLTQIDILYVTPGNEDRLEAIARWTREQDALTVTPLEEYVENGLSVGLVSKGAGGGITLNLPASIEEGREWNVNVLQIARVIRGDAGAAISSATAQ